VNKDLLDNLVFLVMTVSLDLVVFKV